MVKNITVLKVQKKSSKSIDFKIDEFTIIILFFNKYLLFSNKYLLRLQC